MEFILKIASIFTDELPGVFGNLKKPTKKHQPFPAPTKPLQPGKGNLSVYRQIIKCDT